MTEVLRTIAERVVARLTGPLSARFFVQPLVAVLIGIRDGRLDAKAGTPPFVMDLMIKPADRPRAIHTALKSLLVPIILGSVLDAVAQYLIFHQVHPGVAVFMGVFVMGIPYSAARGISNRIATAARKRRDVAKASCE